MTQYVFFFDLDGTLVDSLEDLANAANRVLALHAPHKPLVLKDFVRSAIGDGSRIFISKIFNATDLEEITFYEKIYHEDYVANCAVETKLYAEMLETLECLQLKKIPMAVISNKPVKLVEKILATLKLTSYFFAILGGDSAAAPKPNPDVFRLATQKLNRSIAPQYIVHVGDGTQDIQAAKNYGCISCWASWGFNQDHSLGPDLVAHQPKDIIEIADALSRNHFSTENFPARFRYDRNQF